MDRRVRQTWRSTLTSRALGRALLLAVPGVLALLAATTTAQQSTNTQGQQGRQLSLHDQLTFGLRAFTPMDRAFVDKVVLAVEQGILPRRLVDGTFLWARERAARRSRARQLRAMVYFQPALVLRARRLGIEF